MVLRNALVAAIWTGFLASAGAASAAEYRPSEYLRLDLSRAVISPRLIGPEASFGQGRIVASDDEVQAEPDADLEASVWPKLPPKAKAAKTVGKPSVKPAAEARRTPARAKLAKRQGNPLDAQARDTRIQTWPCKSGGICNWQR